MLRKLLITTVILAVSAGTALAHDYTLTYTHLLKVVAPAEAQGKAVVSVTARVGVLAMHMPLPGYPQPPFPQPPYWAAEKTIDLLKTGNHFFAKHRLNVIEIPPGPRMGPVMVELTLSFADGETLVLRPETAPVDGQYNTNTNSDYNEALASALGAYNDTDDAEKTSVTTISLYRRGPSIPF